MKAQEYKEKTVIIGFLVVYAALYILVSFFHEPWFDEAQAWQIARTASLRDILFVIPHYEGHPALWHLILAIPAKLGLPYEISLKAVGFIFTMSSAAVFVIKSPFPRWIRLVIPFSYFFFYQYGIIVRPYCMIILFFLLTAMVYKHKDDKPLRFVACLVGICLCSAMGIVIAGGIALAWVIDILAELKAAGKTRYFYADKRLWSLLLLAIIAMGFVLQILPAEDAYAVGKYSIGSIMLALLVSVFGFIPDLFVTENSWSGCEINLHYFAIDIGSIIMTCFLGLIIWAGIIIFSGKKALKFLIIPYMFFALFASFVYCYSHHVGILVFLLIFWAWINLENYCWQERLEKIKKKIYLSKVYNKISNREKKLIKIVAVLGAVYLLGFSILWTVQTSVLDIKYKYSYGRDLADFLTENRLNELNIVSEWQTKDITNVYYMQIPVNVLPYIEDSEGMVANMIYPYVLHKKATTTENEYYYNEWSNLEIPDILLGYPDLAEITNGSVSGLDYSPVYRLDMNFCWKGATYIAYSYVFMRNDLLEEYGLENMYDSLGSGIY